MPEVALPDQLNFGLQYDNWGQLVLIDAEGKRYIGVHCVRAFPLHDPDRWISIVDSAGRELACIEDPSKLPAKTRHLLEETLAKTVFLPLIRRVVRASEGEPSEWVVETDRGSATLVLTSEDDVRGLGDGRALLIDSEGVRYLIPKTSTMDAASRRILERFF